MIWITDILADILIIRKQWKLLPLWQKPTNIATFVFKYLQNSLVNSKVFRIGKKDCDVIVKMSYAFRFSLLLARSKYMFYDSDLVRLYSDFCEKIKTKVLQYFRMAFSTRQSIMPIWLAYLRSLLGSHLASIQGMFIWWAS